MSLPITHQPFALTFLQRYQLNRMFALQQCTHAIFKALRELEQRASVRVRGHVLDYSGEYGLSKLSAILGTIERVKVVGMGAMNGYMEIRHADTDVEVEKKPGWQQDITGRRHVGLYVYTGTNFFWCWDPISTHQPRLSLVGYMDRDHFGLYLPEDIRLAPHRKAVTA